jgi:hypothetical protein
MMSNLKRASFVSLNGIYCPILPHFRFSSQAQTSNFKLQKKCSQLFSWQSVLNLISFHKNSMSLFQQATQLNNEGVTALLEGESQAAIDVMTKSIKLMKQELSKLSKERKPEDYSSAALYLEVSSVEIPETDSF